MYHKSSLLSGTGSGDLRVISLTNSFHISNLEEILYWFHWDYDRVIITKCWTCKHSSAVIACAKICINLMTRNIITEPFFCIKFLTGVKNYLWNGDLFKLGLAQVSHVFHLKLLSEMKLKSYNHQLSWGQMGLWHITLKQGWRQSCEVICVNPIHTEFVWGNVNRDLILPYVFFLTEMSGYWDWLPRKTHKHSLLTSTSWLLMAWQHQEPRHQ